MEPGKINSLTLREAIEMADKWRGKKGTYKGHANLRGFWIPKEDMLEILTEGVGALRAYIGVDADNEEKLMFVGLKYDLATKTWVDMLPEGTAEKGGIYDFTRPCPPACDATSPLH